MKTSRFIRRLYRVQQQVGLTGPEFRAVVALAAAIVIGTGFEAWSNRVGSPREWDYAEADSIFQAITARAAADRLPRMPEAAYPSPAARPGARPGTGTVPAASAPGASAPAASGAAAAPGASPAAAPGAAASGAAAPDTLEGRIRLNEADRETLMTLPRIGPALAARILEHRARFGAFLSVDDLLMIQGIGPATLARLRPLLYVEPIKRDSARVIHDQD